MLHARERWKATMNALAMFSKTAARTPRTRAIRKAAYLAIFVLSTTVISSAQTGPVLGITVSGPYSFKDTPAVPSYKVTITNTSQTTASSITLNHALSTTDGAYFIAAEPSQGTCELGGQGITALSCALGSLDPG